MSRLLSFPRRLFPLLLLLLAGIWFLGAASEQLPNNNSSEVETSPSNASVAVSEMAGSEDEEKRRSFAIFFILFVLVMAILLVHAILVHHIHWIPESLAIVLLGGLVGILTSYSGRDLSEAERLSPSVFFLVLLPPIIFESGYNLNKANFFSNLFPILSFAVLGTVISSVVMGVSLYILGLADLVYRLSIFESFAFAAMISAVDPVATLAIFQAVKVETLLYMLVFGESTLNDVVSIVLASTTLRLEQPEYASLSSSEAFMHALGAFVVSFFVSALLGAALGLVSALLFKHVDLRRTPSLEFALLLIFAYIPYGLAEALYLSGIIAILFGGITMSVYTHNNISPITQITMKHTFRTIAFVAETCTFAYLGMAFFSIQLNFQPMFIIWTIVLCLVSRALNVFPLSFIVNRVRQDVQISLKNQIIMWFSGMRGAVCFALALHLPVGGEARSVIVTTTLFVVLFTIVFLGGTALPFINFINKCFPDKKRRRRRRPRRSRSLLLSKTHEMSVFGNDDWKAADGETSLGRLMQRVFVRKFTAAEKEENRQKLRVVTNKALLSEDDEEDEQLELPQRPLLPLTTESQESG